MGEFRIKYEPVSMTCPRCGAQTVKGDDKSYPNHCPKCGSNFGEPEYFGGGGGTGHFQSDSEQ